MPAPKIRFEPTEYAIEELQFLLTNLQKPPSVLREIKFPIGIVRMQILKIVTQCYELQEKLTNLQIPWAGYDKVRDSIERTLAWYQTCAELARRGGPVHASMQAWDGNRYQPRGVESDSQMVRTEILKDGSRRPLGLDLASPGGQSVGPNLIGAAPWLEQGGGSPNQDLLAATPTELVYEENLKAQTGTVQCPICQWTESYKTQTSGSRNVALTRMKKHLKQSKTDRDKHAILYGRISGKSLAA